MVAFVPPSGNEKPLGPLTIRNDDQTWEVKGEKRTSENRRKINGLKASKN